jgi:LysM repeat protein
MAVKKSKPRKFKQARKDAKSAAKSTFSGKSQARLKDPKLRLTADDKEALDEMKKMAKSDLGDKAYLNKKEYDAQQRAAREEFRSKMRSEFGEYGGKSASDADVQAPKRTMTEKAKANVDKTKGKGMNKTRTFVQATEVKPQGKVLKKKAANKAESTKTFKPRSTKPSANPRSMPKTAKGRANFGKYGALDEYQIEKNLEREAKAKKPGTKGYSAGKSLTTEAGKARYKELIDQGVKPKSAMNKALFAEEKASKKNPSSKSKLDLNKSEKEIADLKKNNPKQYKANEKSFKDKVKASTTYKSERAAGKTPADAAKKANPKLFKESSKTPKYVQSTRVTGKEVEVRPKAGTPSAPASSKAAAKPAAKKFGKLRKGAKGFVGVTLATEAVSALKGSTEKDFREIQKLENRLAVAQGKPRKYTNMGSNKNLVESSKADLSNIANLVTMGAVGKTRRDRMDELNAKIAKAEKAKGKQIAKQRAAKPGMSPTGARSSSKINKTFVTASGSTTSITPGSRYTVKSGDTLSGIAKSAGVKLSDVLAANPNIANKKSKYKGGSMIWSGTKVKLPTKKK